MKENNIKGWLTAEQVRNKAADVRLEHQFEEAQYGYYVPRIINGVLIQW